jgi:serine/threonine protein kinase
MRAGQPTMFALCEQRDVTGDVCGVLGLRIRPDEDFVRILKVAQPGETGETYAFDRQGLMLSESRFTRELMTLGLIPDQPVARAQLSLTLRDPGVDLLKGQRSAGPRAELPLTRLVTNAIQGESGADVKGYRGYRGVPVVGAWTWLKDYEMGVATEMDVAEAYRSLYILRRAFWSLFGLLGASSVLILLFTLAVARSERSAQQAVLMAKELGQYQLETKLGEGGMGVVYRGRHRMMRRPTAIKLLHPDKTTDDGIARFEREVQLTCQLNHPNTIAIYDYGRTPEGVFFYAMEFLDGINLDALITRYGPQPEGRVIHLLRQICGSLAEAHGIGLVHRDIKPANIMVGHRGGESDVVKVLDFGLVKAVDSKKESSITSAGAVIGTPLYMSPESIENPDRVDSRSDLYSVAAVGYCLLTGGPPFDGGNVLEICMHHSRTPPERPSERLKRTVSADLEEVLLKGLAKKPAERFASARVFAEALAGCASAGQWSSQESDEWWKRLADGSAVSVDGTPTTGMNEAATVLLAELSKPS